MKRTTALAAMRRAIPTIVICLFVTFLFERAGILDFFNNFAIDLFTIVHPAPEPRDVFIVAIDEQDYHRTFGATSPLDRPQLQKILDAVVAGHPQAIGIDIQTDDPRFRKLHVPDGAPPIVWVARPIVHNEPCWWWFACSRYEPGTFLGGNDPDGDCARSCAAIPFILPARGDAVIRRYLLKVPSTHDREIESFSAKTVAACAYGTRSATLAAHCRAARQRFPGQAAEQIINFTGTPWSAHTLRAADVVALARATQNGGEWADGSLDGKIVLIGGTYPEARDSYATPLGERAGVEVVADAIESELGGGVSDVQEWIGYLVDVTIGLAIAACVPFLSFRRALLLGFIAIPLLGAIVSYLVFQRFGYWFNVVPIAFGVYLHELADHAREYVRLRDAVERAGMRELLDPDEEEIARVSAERA